MTLPTTRDYAGVHTHAVCPSCDHWQALDLTAIVAAGHGDVPLIELKLRCSQCGRTGQKLKLVAGLTDWQNRRSRSLTCLPQRASPMLPPCSSSPKQMPPRSALPMSKRANCRRPSRCAGCSPASPKTQRHGHAPEPSPAGHHGPRRLVRSPRYAFVGAGLGRRSRDRTRPRWNGAARRGGQRTSRPLILSRCADRW